MFFIGFLILFYLIQPQATTSIGYTKPYAKPKPIKFFITLYTNDNTLWVKPNTIKKLSL